MDHINGGPGGGTKTKTIHVADEVVQDDCSKIKLTKIRKLVEKQLFRCTTIIVKTISFDHRSNH